MGYSQVMQYRTKCNSERQRASDRPVTILPMHDLTYFGKGHLRQ